MKYNAFIISTSLCAAPCAAAVPPASILNAGNVKAVSVAPKLGSTVPIAQTGPRAAAQAAPGQPHPSATPIVSGANQTVQAPSRASDHHWAYHPRRHHGARSAGHVGRISPVDVANRAALQDPNTHGFLGAVQVYPFSEGALYRLYAAPEQVSDIALQPGEALIAVAAGDTVRWIIGDTTSGSGTTKQTHILVKPSVPDLKTNLIITTSARVYHLTLESTSHTAMAALSWNYPQDALIALQRHAAESEAAQPIASGVALDHLHFNYTISGDSPSWRPLRAFDDGTQVFIEFADTLGTGEAPPLVVLGANGDSQLVNYRVKGHFYVVDRLFDTAELRLGEKPQSVVRISRTGSDAKPAKHHKGKML